MLVPEGTQAADFELKPDRVFAQDAGRIPGNSSTTALLVDLPAMRAEGATIVARAGESRKTAALPAAPSRSPQARAVSPLDITCDQRSISPGGSTTCELQFDASAASAPIEFSLFSNSNGVRLPATLHSRAGANRVRFEAEADAAMQRQSVAVTVISRLGIARASLSVDALPSGMVERQHPAFTGRHPAVQAPLPQLLSADGSGSGQGLVIGEGGLAALPRAGLDSTPAVPGEAVKLYATGIECVGRTGTPAVLVDFGGRIQPTVSLTPTTLTGVCEVTAVVPAGSATPRVPVSLEMVGPDGTLARSNTVLLAVDE